MKKILAIAIAILMMATMVVTAFAETTLTGEMGYVCTNTDEGHVCEEVEEGYPSCYEATGLTHSAIGDGNTLELGKDYFIDVFGKLDSNNNGIPDEEEEPLDPVAPTINIDIYWTDMVFNYTKTWDDATLADIWTWQTGEDYITVENRSSVDVNAAITFTGNTTDGTFNYEDENEIITFSVATITGDDSDVEALLGATWNNNVLALEHGNMTEGETEEVDDGEGGTITVDKVTAPYGTINVNVADGVTMKTGDTDAKSVTLGQITINVSQAAENDSGSGSESGSGSTEEPVETVDTLTMDLGTTTYEFNVSESAVKDGIQIKIDDAERYQTNVYYREGYIVEYKMQYKGAEFTGFNVDNVYLTIPTTDEQPSWADETMTLIVSVKYENESSGDYGTYTLTATINIIADPVTE